MKEITLSSLKSSLTNKHQNCKFMLTDILLEDCPLKKKKKKERTLLDFTSGYEIQSVKILQQGFCVCVCVCVCVFFFYHSFTPKPLPFLLATWLNMIQKSEFIHYNYLGRQTLSVLI